MTNFHSLVDQLGHAGVLGHPDAVDVLMLALENGADYGILSRAGNLHHLLWCNRIPLKSQRLTFSSPRFVDN